MKTTKSIRFIDSLKGRILLFLTLPTILIILAIVFMIAQSSFSSARQQAEYSLKQATQLVALEIERRNANAIRTAKMMVLAQEEGLFGNRKASSDLAHRVMNEFSEYTGAYFGYERDINGKDELFTNKEYAGKTADESGRFLPYWYKEGNNLVVTPLADMATSLYYDGVKKLFEKNNVPLPLVTEPYVYQGKMIVEQTYPITRNGKFLGIGGVDRSLTDIEQLLQQIKQKTKRDIYLISRDGRFISTTIKGVELQTKLINETQYRNLFSPIYENRQTPKVFLDNDPISDDTFFFSSQLINTGEWLLIIRESEKQVLAPIEELFFKTSVFVSVGVVVLILLSLWFVRSISLRIHNVMLKAEKIAIGDTSKLVDLGSTVQDEIHAMDESLDKVSTSYAEIDRLCSLIAEGDFSAKMEKRSDR